MAGCFFYNLREKCYRKSCKYMRNNSTRQKDFNFTILKFRVQRYGDMWPKKVGKPFREKRRAHFTQAWYQRIWKLCTKGRPAGKLTWCEHSRDLLDYCWWDNMQRSSPKNTGRTKTATTLRLTKKENLDTLWELVHSIPRRLKNVRKHKGGYPVY